MASRMKFYGDKVVRKFKRDAPGITNRIAGRIAGHAQDAAPVKSGTLKNSIHADGNTVVADVDYAAAVELGTAKRAARPFMRPGIAKFDNTDLKQCI